MNDIDNMMGVLDQRPSAGLARLAEHARQQLADIPTIGTWNLERPEGPDAVGGLLHAIKQSDDKRKDRWYAAAMLLWWCLHVDPERLRPRDVRIIQVWASAPDSEHGKKFTPGRPREALAPLTQWIMDYLRRHPTASNADILRRLRYDEPDAERVETNDRDQTGVAFRGKPVPKKRLRERARECRSRLGISTN